MRQHFFQRQSSLAGVQAAAQQLQIGTRGWPMDELQRIAQRRQVQARGLRIGQPIR